MMIDGNAMFPSRLIASYFAMINKVYRIHRKLLILSSEVLRRFFDRLAGCVFMQNIVYHHLPGILSL